MTPPRSFIGTLTSMNWLARFRNRAVVFGILIAICAVLTFFPQRFRAEATLTPTDPASLGLSGTLGQLGASNSVFGNQAAVEVALRVANSIYVRDIVIKNTDLAKRLEMKPLELHRWLVRKVDIRSLRGGIILIQMDHRDPQLADKIVSAYTSALQDRLGEIARSQTTYKRGILEKLVSDASRDFADAQARFDAFRLQQRQPAPGGETDLVNQRIVMLESAIHAKRIGLQTARQLYTDDNTQVRQIKAEIAALQGQLAQARATDPSQQDNVGSVVENSRKLYKLERELNLQRGLYDNYKRFLEGTAVENLASTANVRILEPPYVETERQYWLPALVAGLAFALLWGAIEFYRLRPPVGAPIIRDEQHA